MKFAEHLSAHITPEWRKQYINYEIMKQQLYNSVEKAPVVEEVEPDVLSRFVAKVDETFFHYCDRELAKINTFFSEKLAEATRKLANLKAELQEATEEQSQMNQPGNSKFLRKKKKGYKINDLKLAFSEFYLSLILLQNYQNLNFTGFRKILKKHDKLLNVENGALFRMEHVETSAFYTNKDIDRIIREVESIVTTDLEGGDRQKAMKRLRVPPLGEKQSPWITFKVGLFSGAFLILLISVILSSITKTNFNWIIAIRLFRAPLLVVELLFLLGVNVYGWRSAGVNHVLIFELDPRNHLTEQHIMEVAAVFGVVWALSVLAFLYSNELSIPTYGSPLVLHLLMILFLLNPTRTFQHEARFWVLKVLCRIIFAPFFFVNFADFWLADQLTSLIPIFLDLQYFICFYSSNIEWPTTNVIEDRGFCLKILWGIRPIVTILPAWFRFAQCFRRWRDTKEAFPHLANAGKYATTFVVIIFSTLYHRFKTDEDDNYNIFFYLWILSLLVSSIYSYIWDVKMDWGLFDSKPGENKFLREEIVYPQWYYYFSIIEDLFLRFTWALSISLTEAGILHSDIIVTVFSPFEVFRRFVWNYFRLENEHLNNCGKFRAVRDISVAPIDTSDHVAILRMMDDLEGVVNRHKNKKGGKKKDTKPLIFETGSDEDLTLP